jgi:adenosyl cobinamide kinase/adenosyl cobinamide phosphate guanylyltransferase
MSLRNKLISMSATPAPTIVEIDGITVHIKAPTTADVEAARAYAGIAKNKEQMAGNMNKCSAKMCQLLVVNEDGSPVFEVTDLAVLEKAPLGSMLAKVRNACEEKVAAANPKESEPTVSEG